MHEDKIGFGRDAQWASAATVAHSDAGNVRSMRTGPVDIAIAWVVAQRLVGITADEGTINVLRPVHGAVAVRRGCTRSAIRRLIPEREESCRAVGAPEIWMREIEAP